jgi:hypothetical protein
MLSCELVTIRDTVKSVGVLIGAWNMSWVNGCSLVKENLAGEYINPAGSIRACKVNFEMNSSQSK